MHELEHGVQSEIVQETGIAEKAWYTSVLGGEECANMLYRTGHVDGDEGWMMMDEPELLEGRLEVLHGVEKLC